jgi:filamentous hemagglutinin
MLSLRSAIVWLLLFTQVWGPVLAQTLPISVDKNVPGQRPVVGVAGNGVPIVNIAPPSAGGVSNNRFTQFNVGPSGVVLNNRGAGSQSQLAGAVGGNPMLGNSRATTILNQVTTNNPSQLRGMMEVAGNRANVIVANPAGIVCDGCGFLNANRGTLTTGLPLLGPDGGVQGFDVTRGRLSIEGQGLNGENLDQVDLIARSLALNASVWANRLNVVAGPAVVGYGDGSVQAKPGADAAPVVSLDMAALGSMYANSIRLVGTEAGVGVNIGGNLAAMTGDLQVSAAGDVHILPSGKVQAAGNLQLDVARTITVDGGVAANRDVQLNAAGNIVTNGSVNAGGNLLANAGESVLASGGMSASGNLRANAAGDLAIGQAGRLEAGGALLLQAGRDLSAAGLASAGGGAVLRAARDLRVDGFASAYGGDLTIAANGNLAQGSGARMQAGGGLNATAGGALALAGATVGVGAVTLQSNNGMSIDGQVGAGRDATLTTGGTLAIGTAAQVQADGSLNALAGQGAVVAGVVSSNQGMSIQATRDIRLDGVAVSYGADLRLVSGGDFSSGTTGRAQAQRDMSVQSGGSLAAGGTFSAIGGMALTAAGNISATGQLAADGNLAMDAGSDIAVGGTGHVQAGGVLRADAARNLTVAGLMGTTGAAGAASALTARAGQDMSIGGTVTANSPLTLVAAGNMRVDGLATAAGGDLVLTSGRDMTFGAAGRAQASADLVARSGGNISTAGVLAANQAMRLVAAGNTQLDGTVAALGAGLTLSSGNDIGIGSGGRVQAASTLAASAGRDLSISGAVSSVGDLTLKATQDATLNGIAASDAGLALSARNVNIGGAGVAQAGKALQLDAAGQLDSAGKIVGNDLVALHSTGNLALSGTTASIMSGLNLQSAAGDIVLAATARTQAAGMLTATAARDLVAQGTTSSNGGIDLQATRDLSLDGITAALGGDLRINAGGTASVAAQGRAQASGSLVLNAGGTLDNDGLLSAGLGSLLQAGSDLNNRGTVVAVGDVRASSTGALNNAGRFLAGMDDQGQVALAGNLTLSGNLLSNSGLAAAGGDVALDGSSLLLAGGTVSASQALNATTSGGIDARGANLYGGTVTLSGSSLDNRGGKLSSGGDLNLDINGLLDNQAGTIATNGALLANASQVMNQGGTIIGHDLTVTTPGDINNAGGLMQANNALVLSAANLVNTDTPSTNPSLPLGIVGNIVSVNATTIDNTRGTLAASDTLTLTAAQLQNAAGLVSSGRNANITVGTLANQGGNVAAGESLSITANALTGTGTVQSQGDLRLALNGSLNNTGVLAAGRDATLLIAGDLDNSGKISAGRDLTLDTRNLTNRASGEIVSNGVTTVRASQALDNAGLIDGHFTHVQAGSIVNTGRIYGDTLSISTGYLRNDVGAAGAGVIASRGDLDLGVGTLDNLEHGLIYAAGDLAIGGGLDGTWKATGQAQTVNNSSATIEAGGNASIAAVTINNLNNHFSSEVVQVSSGARVYYRLDGTTDLLDGSTYWLCDQTTALCSQDPAWLEDDQERRLLLPSSTYPQDRYGPPFTYANGGHGRKGISAPVALPYDPPMQACTGGGDAGDNCTMLPEAFHYAPDAAIWDVFGVAHPTPLPPAPVFGENCQKYDDCVAMQAVYDQAHAPYAALYTELNNRVLAYNADFNNRLVKDFTIYEVDENVSENRTVSTDPGKIIAGANATLTGSVVNDKSQIVAGAALSIVGPTIQNIGATGERRIDATGQEIYTYEKNDDRKYDIVPYSGTISTQPIELAVASYGGNTAPPSTGAAAPGASTPASASRPPVITSVALPGLGIVRTVTPPSGVPNSQLYTVVPGANSPYLVATDPRFTGQRPTVSSDYLLDLLHAAGPGVNKTPAGGAPSSSGGSGGVNVQAPTHTSTAANTAAGTSQSGNGAAPISASPTSSNPYLDSTDTLKRLGDGFYEQKLVADQVMAATGQRFVGDYTDNESQYKALLTAGATFAEQYGLVVGTPLTDEQMSHLTSDMVWLVDQTVTLPDGSTQTVLVPQVYLVVQDGDLKGDGTLMAGGSVSLQADGDITNTGTIGSRNATVMVADNIRNSAGGTVQGSTVNLLARQDLDNIAALIKGDTVALQAGHDVNLTTTTASSTGTNTWGTYVSGVSQIDTGSLQIQAGNDLNLTAASLNVKDDARLQAGNDINLLTVQQVQGESVVFKKKDNNSEVIRANDIGTTIDAGGDLTLVAGQDVNATAANVSAAGDIAVGAGRDINLLAGQASGYARDEHYQKTTGFWSTTTQHSIYTGEWTQAQASTFTGASAVFMAGQDANVVGSNIGATGDVVINADRNVNIVAAENTSYEDHYLNKKRSGWGALGGLSYGTNESTDTLDATKVFHTGSTVGSIQGDVLINAGDSLQVLGSNVLAREGDINMVGSDVTIASVTDTDHEKEYHEVKTSGFSIEFGSPALDAAQTIDRMTHASSETDNPIMKALALATAATSVVNAADAISRGGEDGGGAATITLNYGASKSSSTTEQSSSTVAGSTVAAGNNLTIVARGAGDKSDITVLGSSLSAGNNAVIKADGDILLQAAANTAQQHTENQNVDGKIGVGVMVGSDGEGGFGYGFIVKGSVAGGRGREDGSDLTWTNSSVTAGNILGIQSGGDTSFIGATGKADQILASVGGNLLIQSLQDKSTYDSKNQNFSAGFTYCYGYCSSSAYASYNQGQMNSNFQTVTQQTGLWAGDGGFQIDVKNNTTLIGSVIASSDKAVADGLNQLSTGTLATHDIHNTASYDGYQMGVGVSSNMSDWSSSAGAPSAAFAMGDANSTTESAISAGNINIRDASGQLLLTGTTVEEMLASVNHDTSDTLNSLSPIFDKEKVQAGFDIVSEATQQAATFLANRARDAKSIQDALAAEVAKGEDADPVRLAQLNADYASARQWLPGGSSREAMNILVAAAAGNVTGGVGQFVQDAAMNYLQAEGAQAIKDLLSKMSTGPERESVRAALQAVLACGTAAGKGASCGGGAAGAGLASVLGFLLNSNGADPQEAESLINLVNGLATAVVAGLGGDAVTASIAAKIEAENNSFFRHRTYVAEMTAPQRTALDDAYQKGQITQGTYEDSIRALDASSTKLDALMTIYKVDSAVGLSQVLPQMSQDALAMFTEAISDLLLIPGMVSSAYTLVTGETPVSHEEASRFFAILGVVPGEKIVKGVGKLAETVKVLTDIKAIAALKQIAANQAKGMSFEQAVLEYLVTAKNTTSFTAKVGDRLVTVIPDGLRDGNKILEIKDAAYLSKSSQFRAYAALVAEGGIAKNGVNAGKETALKVLI